MLVIDRQGRQKVVVSGALLAVEHAGLEVFGALMLVTEARQEAEPPEGDAVIGKGRVVRLAQMVVGIGGKAALREAVTPVGKGLFGADRQLSLAYLARQHELYGVQPVAYIVY